MVVEVGPEIEQFILQICTRPEQHGIQIFASNGAKCCHLQDPQIGLPWVELIERIMVGAEVLWQPALTSNGAVKHAPECDPIDRALSGGQNVHAVPSQVTYDKLGLQLLNISSGNFLSQGEQIVALVHREDPASGAVEITASRPPGSEGVSGHGVVATLTFQASATGRSPVKITKAAVVQPDQQLSAASGSEITYPCNDRDLAQSQHDGSLHHHRATLLVR
jgi:hypothetical protein